MQVKALENFRENVKLAITELGINQYELADKAEISRPYLNRLLREKQEPSISVCDRISDALGFSFAALLSPPQVFRRMLQKNLAASIATH